MATTKSQPEAQPFPPLSEIGAKALDAVSAVAEANQRVAGRLIELSSSAAADRLRTLGELTTAAMDAARTAWSPVNPREAFEELRHDPFAWYRKGVLAALDGTHWASKLLKTNAQIVARDAECFQASAIQSGKEIESAVSTCASRLRDIYR